MLFNLKFNICPFWQQRVCSQAARASSLTLASQTEEADALKVDEKKV
jgi:hypothetical protein